MIKIANAQFWVHDQDEALAFYTKTLGWEVRADVTMEAWNFRWLCVARPARTMSAWSSCPCPDRPCSTRRQCATGRAGGQGGGRHPVPRDRRLPGSLRRAVGSVASCSTTPRPRRRTESTRRSGIRRGTTSGSPRSSSSIRRGADHSHRHRPQRVARSFRTCAVAWSLRGGVVVCGVGGRHRRRGRGLGQGWERGHRRWREGARYGVAGRGRCGPPCPVAAAGRDDGGRRLTDSTWSNAGTGQPVTGRRPRTMTGPPSATP